MSIRIKHLFIRIFFYFILFYQSFCYKSKLIRSEWELNYNGEFILFYFIRAKKKKIYIFI